MRIGWSRAHDPARVCGTFSAWEEKRLPFSVGLPNWQVGGSLRNDARRVQQSGEVEKQTKSLEGPEFWGQARPEARGQFCTNQL